MHVIRCGWCNLLRLMHEINLAESAFGPFGCKKKKKEALDNRVLILES